MVAFNFRARFVDAIKSGKKTSTIRKSLRCKVGNNMQLYTGQRTKACKKIADAVCVGTGIVGISNDDIKLYATDGVVPKGQDGLVTTEGFSSKEDLISFFSEHHGLPFVGYAYFWEVI